MLKFWHEPNRRNKNSTFGIVIRLWAGIEVIFLEGIRDLCPLHRVVTGSVTHPVS
jgi:hypothetical protein